MTQMSLDVLSNALRGKCVCVCVCACACSGVHCMLVRMFLCSHTLQYGVALNNV